MSADGLCNDREKDSEIERDYTITKLIQAKSRICTKLNEVTQQAQISLSSNNCYSTFIVLLFFFIINFFFAIYFGRKYHF